MRRFSCGWWPLSLLLCGPALAGHDQRRFDLRARGRHARFGGRLVQPVQRVQPGPARLGPRAGGLTSRSTTRLGGMPGGCFITRRSSSRPTRRILHAVDGTHRADPLGYPGRQPELPQPAPGANNFFVAVTNGSSLYVLNRFNGKLLFSTKLPGTPARGPP